MLAARLLGLALAAVMSVGTVGGVDMDYEGEVDIYTGSPVSSENTEGQRTVTLADGGLYNHSTRMFVYNVPNSNLSIYSSVANGMIVRGPVRLEYDSGLNARLYLDGEEDENMDLDNLTKTGSYSLVVSGADVEQQMLTFTIIPEKTGALNNYKLPLGFDLTEITVSGIPKEITDVGNADMSENGEYIISYHCNLTGVDYGLNVTVDHIPPEITLEGVENGVARGPVTVKDDDGSDSLTVLLDGESITYPSDGRLTLPGKYEVTVTDDAGNSIVESFEIQFYLNYQGLLFGLLFLAVIGAAIAYMVWSRKNLRVR